MTLSQRIATLQGPDRAVDAEVAVALGFERDGDVFRTEREDFILERDYYSLEGGLRELPRFTGSLDAARSVVPEGWRCGFEQAGQFDRSELAEAWCWPFDSSFDPDWQNGHEGYRSAPEACRAAAADPILALLSAALKAGGL